jgi:3-hydroxy-9,10-secoandrosta-1,3,5(10)-triene-9,17-dione monooxygenase reductase component
MNPADLPSTAASGVPTPGGGVAATAGLPPPSPQALRAALGRFATGVAIIACVDAAGRRIGLTANSFSALSLDPPLVLWSLRRSSPSLPSFATAAHFAVNVLAESQVGLSRRFASSQVADKFDEGHWAEGIGQAPVLAGCAAVFECATERELDGGDHALFIGRVLRISDVGVAPLVFQGGHYRMLGEVL